MTRERENTVIDNPQKCFSPAGYTWETMVRPFEQMDDVIMRVLFPEDDTINLRPRHGGVVADNAHNIRQTDKL